MDYKYKCSFKKDLEAEKVSKTNIVKLLSKISFLWLTAGLAFQQALISYKNHNKYFLFIFFLSFSLISASFSVIINNEESLTNNLLKEKMNLLNEEQKRKLLVLFLVGEKRWLGGENMIENIIKDTTLYMKLKQINEGLFNEKELNNEIFNWMRKDI